MVINFGEIKVYTSKEYTKYRRWSKVAFTQKCKKDNILQERTIVDEFLISQQ